MRDGLLRTGPGLDVLLGALGALQLAGGDKLDEALQQLARLDHWRPLDLHGIRDRIAEAVIGADGWSVK